jgi:hypothetical protein
MYNPYWPNREQDKFSDYMTNRNSGMSMRKSALEAGYAESTANIAHERLEPRRIQTMKDALESAGVTKEKISAVILEGLSATKLVTSPTEPDKEVVDYGERRQYAKLSLEAMGELQSKPTVAIQINLPNAALTEWGDE